MRTVRPQPTSARALAAALVVAAALGLGGAHPAAANPSSCATDPPPKPSARIVHTTLEGLAYNVLLPSGYASSPQRRYPVLYLLHALDYDENTWLDLTDVQRFTASFTDRRAAIVVMPDGGPGGWYSNWPDGSEPWERYHLHRLIPAVDRRFRTLRGRAHRAVAGFSMGGDGALEYATRHPSLFVAVGGFSPLAHMTTPEPAYGGAPASDGRFGAGSPRSFFAGRRQLPYRTPDDDMSGCSNSSNQWGDRNRDSTVWHAHDPTDLASNLRGMTVYVASGNGTPCDALDPVDRPNFVEPGDAATLAMSKAFAAAAQAAHVAVTTDFYGCGVHTMRYAERDLHHFWPLMVGAFGRASPRSFDHRAADPDFALWGWTFHADPRRALEFLEVRHASRAGFTLTGSGTESVVTGRLFAPGRRVAVSGALPAVARAGRAGRLRLRVDLGPAHTSPQFRPTDSHPHFVTRVVRLTPTG